MKLLMIATAFLVLSGCERAAEVEQQSRLEEQQVTTYKPVQEFTVEYRARYTYLIIDEVTGCQYVVFTSSGDSITPRLNSDGTQVCHKAVTP